MAVVGLEIVRHAAADLGPLERPAHQLLSAPAVRIFSGPDERELLSQLRVRLDRRALPEMTLLGLEWVLLQNLRAALSDGRPPLPGQRHPGLGLLGDVMALRILLAERLELDGIRFVPSHYHLAATSKRYLRSRGLVPCRRARSPRCRWPRPPPPWSRGGSSIGRPAARKPGGRGP